MTLLTTEQKPPNTSLATLVIMSGERQGTRVELDLARLLARPFVIGRQSQSDLVPGLYQDVSRQHATLTYRAEDRQVILSDAGSANGTTLNGKPLACPTPLLPGDFIGCGPVMLLYTNSAVPLVSQPSGENYYPEDREPGWGRLEVISSQVPKLMQGAFSRLTPAHSFLIGRQLGCDLRLMEADESQALTISRRQLELFYRDEAYFARELSGSNPTLINRQALKPDELMRLKDGAVIEIGTSRLRYRAPRQPFIPDSNSQPALLLSPARLRYISERPLQSGFTCLALPIQQPLKIGRAKGQNLRLDDPSVSRAHATIAYADGKFQLADAGSTNGTELNGQLLQQPAFLEPGDRLKLGEFEFIFEVAAPGAWWKTPSALENPVKLQFVLELDKLLPEASRETLTLGPTPGEKPDLLLTRPFRMADFKRWQETTALPELELDIIYDESGGFRLSEYLLKTGQLVTVGSHQPFLLNDPEICWLVRSGKVEIFSVQLEKGQPITTRQHVCSILPGQTLFGTDSDWYGKGLALIAVATGQTELLKLPLVYLRQAARHLKLSAMVAQTLDEWLAGLSAGLSRRAFVAETDKQLEPGGAPLTLETGQVAFARRGREGVWASFSAGPVLFLGEEEIKASSGEMLFPLYGSTWVQATDSTTLTADYTGNLINQAALWDGLELFYAHFFRARLNNLRLAINEEINRLREKSEHNQALYQAAIVRLSEITGGPEAFIGPVQTSEEALLVACQLVGQTQGISIAPPSRLNQSSRPQLLVEEIARASHIRIREVTLEDDWWRRENGPLLAFLKSEQKDEDATLTPVALLPRLKQGGYDMVNPRKGSRERFDSTVATLLGQSAYVFYRPFPEKPLKLTDLLWFGLRNSRKDWMALGFLGLATGLLGLLVPVVTGFLFDKVIPTGKSAWLWQILIALLVAALSGLAFQFTRGLALLRIETRLEVNLQSALWDKLLSLPLSFFKQYAPGELAGRAMGFQTIQHLISGSVLTALLGSIFSLASFFLLFSYSPPLAWLSLLLVSITLAVIVTINWMQLRYKRRLVEQQGRLSSLVLQLLRGIVKLRVSGAETPAFALWVKEFTEQRRTAFKAGALGNRLLVFNAVWSVVTVMLIFAATGGLNKSLSTGSFLAFLAAFGQFLTALLEMAAALVTVSQVIPLYERIKPILETAPEVNRAKVDPGELSGALEINHLSFRYEPELPDILQDVTMKVEPGQFVAIVGPSGSGKSTLLRLLLGFETPTNGAISYDNQNLGGIDVRMVRRQIGVVIQNGKLVPGDILSNITGSALYSTEEAWEACRSAGIEADIRAMPMGMFTVVAEDDSTFSGGQRQRLMIARAIIGKPRILFFDEATSALDNQTQDVVNQSLNNLKATRIVIAHRLSTIINADCIYVLQKGKIVQSGAYRELIEQPGLFQELAARQTAREKCLRPPAN